MMNITERTNRGLWYFAHPAAAYDKSGKRIHSGITANFNICNYRASRLLLAGYHVFSPVTHTHPIEESCAEFLCMNPDEIWNMWMDLDLDLLRRTNFTGIILAPGWEQSKGCVLEKEWFELHSKHVLTYEEAIAGDTK